MSANPPAGPRAIFISYRRDDVPEAARSIRNAVHERFGADAVYFDVDEPPGIDWEARIRERAKHADVFLIVMGPRWVSELKVRTAAAKSSGAVDYVRREIEWALRPSNWGGVVIPVLIDTAMPNERDLPRSIKGVCRRQAVMNIRHESFDHDLERLMRSLQDGSAAARESPADGTDPLEEALASGDNRAARSNASSVPPPTEDHYLEVIEEMIHGVVVPWLGDCVRGAPPDSRFLAEQLADAFKELALQSSDLAEIAQSIRTMKGKTRLQTKLRDLIVEHSEPVAVHRFLAAFPGLLRRRGLAVPGQLIISTNYDRALEHAFEAVNEPFDYAIYMPSTRRFVHFPWGESDEEPRSIEIKDPANYDDFPMDDAFELERTVIVKLHGAPNFWEGKQEWPDDYVVTEDQYIDYLPTDAIEDYLPRQLLEKLKGSRCLFLGYALREWSTRVLLRRIWQGMQFSESSWAIEDYPDDLEMRTWRAFAGIELLAAHPSEYIAELRATLDRRFDHMTPARTAA